jgi:hypothetical protein
MAIRDFKAMSKAKQRGTTMNDKENVQERPSSGCEKVKLILINRKLFHLTVFINRSFLKYNLLKKSE